MTGAGDVQDDEVTVSLAGKVLGSFPVDNTVASGPTDDEAGKASVSVQLPAGLPGGNRIVKVTGAETGTVVEIPVSLEKSASSISAKATPKKVVAKKTKPTVTVTVRSGGKAATGKVEVRVGAKTWKATLKNGKASVKLPAFAKAGPRR